MKCLCGGVYAAKIFNSRDILHTSAAVAGIGNIFSVIQYIARKWGFCIKSNPILLAGNTQRSIHQLEVIIPTPNGRLSSTGRII